MKSAVKKKLDFWKKKQFRIQKKRKAKERKKIRLAKKQSKPLKVKANQKKQRKKKKPQPLMKEKNIHENPKIVFLKEDLEKPEEGQLPRLEKDQFEGRRRRSGSLDRYQSRKSKAAKPTKMPTKLVYSW